MMKLVYFLLFLCCTVIQFSCGDNEDLVPILEGEYKLLHLISDSDAYYVTQSGFDNASKNIEAEFDGAFLYSSINQDDEFLKDYLFSDVEFGDDGKGFFNLIGEQGSVDFEYFQILETVEIDFPNGRPSIRMIINAERERVEFCTFHFLALNENEDYGVESLGAVKCNNLSLNRAKQYYMDNFYTGRDTFAVVRVEHFNKR